MYTNYFTLYFKFTVIKISSRNLHIFAIFPFNAEQQGKLCQLSFQFPQVNFKDSREVEQPPLKQRTCSGPILYFCQLPPFWYMHTHVFVFVDISL